MLKQSSGTRQGRLLPFIVRLRQSSQGVITKPRNTTQWKNEQTETEGKWHVACGFYVAWSALLRLQYFNFSSFFDEVARRMVSVSGVRLCGQSEPERSLEVEFVSLVITMELLPWCDWLSSCPAVCLGGCCLTLVRLPCPGLSATVGRGNGGWKIVCLMICDGYRYGVVTDWVVRYWSCTEPLFAACVSPPSAHPPFSLSSLTRSYSVWLDLQVS